MKEKAAQETLAVLIARRPEKSLPLGDIRQDLFPSSAVDAYAIQDHIVSRRKEGVGAWKVGASAEGEQPRCSPITQDCLHASPATLSQAQFSHSGIELEIAFRMKRSFSKNDIPEDDNEILASISSMAAAIEIVSSRFVEWPDVPKLIQLADLLNNGALIVGEFVPYDSNYPFRSPLGALFVDENQVSRDELINTAGDPRSLLPWLIRHSVDRGGEVTPDTIITTGTYVEMHFPRRPSCILGCLAALPSVKLTLA
jgi:2-keto-4-pentenoate hydratase